jgi:hypothetical protein
MSLSAPPNTEQHARKIFHIPQKSHNGKAVQVIADEGDLTKHGIRDRNLVYYEYSHEEWGTVDCISIQFAPEYCLLLVDRKTGDVVRMTSPVEPITGLGAVLVRELVRECRELVS